MLWRRPACWHRARRANSPLLGQFVQNSDILNQVHEQLTANGDRHGIDAEWLIDNFHIIEDSLREVRRDLPPGYDELLPKLSVPPLLGYPRVYALALALVAHTDSELDETRIAAVRPGVPGRGPADDRRALGVADHASPRAPGKPPAAVGEDDLEMGRKPPGRTVGEERDRMSTSDHRTDAADGDAEHGHRPRSRT